MHQSSSFGAQKSRNFMLCETTSKALPFTEIDENLKANMHAYGIEHEQPNHLNIPKDLHVLNDRSESHVELDA